MRRRIILRKIHRPSKIPRATQTQKPCYSITQCIRAAFANIFIFVANISAPPFGSDSRNFLVAKILRRTVTNQVSLYKVTNQVSPYKVTNQVSPYKMTNQVSPYKVTNQVSPYKVTNQVSPYKVTNQVSPYKVTNQGSPYKVTNQGSPYKVTNQGSPYKVTNQGSPYKVTNQGSPYKVTNQVSPYKVTNQVSPYKVTNQGSPCKVTNQVSPYKVTNQVSPYKVTNQVSPYKVTNQVSPYKVTNQGSPYKVTNQVSPYKVTNQVSPYKVTNQVTLLSSPTRSKFALASCFTHHERQKKRAYEQRVVEVENGSFTPLIFSTMGRLASIFYSRLAMMLSEKRQQPFSSTMGWLRCQLSFSFLRSSILCIRGSRSSHHVIPRFPIFTDLATNESRVAPY